MKTLKKAVIGTAAATAMAVSATPAMARDGDGISAGEVIAGAVVIGGLAAILTSGNKNRGDYNASYDRSGRYNNNYGNRGYNNNRGYTRLNARTAVDRCVTAAERRAGRRYGWADVTDIRDVDRTRYGFRVKGRIAVKDQARGYRGRYGYNNRNVDKGKFTCYYDGAGRPQVSFDNLDGSRRY